MSAGLSSGQPVRIVIRRLAIRGASSIDMRRLAADIAPALERALRRSDPSVVHPAWHGSEFRAAHGTPAATRTAELAADAIASAIAARLADTEAAS